MITIGNVRIATNVFLAPLSGCSDLAFRLIAREHGAGFCFFEMIDSHSLPYQRPRTLDILATHPKDSPRAAQLLGNDPGRMLKAAKIVLERTGSAFIDVNCACPSKKVVRRGAGAALLKDPANLYRILETLASGLTVPVTIKMRIGYEKTDRDAIIAFAKGCESAGASALFVHGRTQAQGYMGEIDYAAIRAIKESVAVPVFGSGNIVTAWMAKKMFDETGCDGITVARGTLGNPWIFKEIEAILGRGDAPPRAHSLARRKAVLATHLDYVDRYKKIRPVSKVGFMRKVVIWYTTGLPGATSLRRRISLAKTYPALLDIINSLS